MPAPSVAENRREQAFRIGARQRVGVGVADAGGHDLDQHLAGFWALDVDGFDGQRRASFPGDRGAGFHGMAPVTRIPSLSVRPRESGDPVLKQFALCLWFWIPACAGMSGICIE
jgi:hypothetical protein